MTHSNKLYSCDDAMQIIYSGANGHIFELSDLSPEFFQLSNMLAGEIFQKFVNYRYPVAFIIPKNHELGARVTELIRDHANHTYIRFFESRELALQWLS